MTLRLETALDRAHDAMIRAGSSEPARRAFFAALAAAELVVVLEAEPVEGQDKISPLVVPTEDGEIVLAFDTEARMAAFLDQGTPVVSLSGRALAAMLAPAGLGMGLNLDVAPSSILLPAEALRWLTEVAPAEAHMREDRITKIVPPRDVPEELLATLDARLAMLAGTATRAVLARATFSGGGSGLVLGVFGVVPAAQGAVTQAIAEALSLAGLAEVPLDVLFPGEGSALDRQLAATGLVYEVPQAPEPSLVQVPPGSDPDKPPQL